MQPKFGTWGCESHLSLFCFALNHVIQYLGYALTIKTVSTVGSFKFVNKLVPCNVEFGAWDIKNFHFW